MYLILVLLIMFLFFHKKGQSLQYCVNNNVIDVAQLLMETFVSTFIILLSVLVF